MTSNCIATILIAAWAPVTASAAQPSVSQCLAANDEAIRLDNNHQLRAARASLLTCAAPECPAEVRKECVRRVDDMNDAIPTIIFEARDSAGHDLGQVRVSMGDEVLTERLDGIALAIDPGVQDFRFEAPGQPTLSRRIVVRQGQKNRGELVIFDAPRRSSPQGPAAALAATQPRPGSATAPSAAATTTTTTRAPAEVSRVALAARAVAGSPAPAALDTPGHSHAGLAIAAAVVGVAGIGIGALFGARAISKRDSAQKICPVGACPSQAGVNMWHDARTAGNIATGGFAAGGVALLGAAILWLTSEPEPSSPDVRADVDLGADGVALSVGGLW